MDAWWWEDGLHFGARRRPAVAAAEEVLVRVVLAGICRTDLAVATGKLACAAPCVLGHEVAGIVEAVGPSVRGLCVGDRVACRPQVDGQRLGVDRDGGFSEALVLPARALVKVPPALDWRRAAFVEPVAACLAIRRAPLDGRVRIVGAGRIAELTRRCARSLGVDLSEGLADVVIETAGTAESLAEAFARVRDGGRVVLKSRPAAPVAVDLAAAVVRELKLIGVGWASFEEAFELLEGGLPVEDLLGEVLPLQAFGAQLAAAEDKKRFLAPDPSLCAG